MAQAYSDVDSELINNTNSGFDSDTLYVPSGETPKSDPLAAKNGIEKLSTTRKLRNAAKRVIQDESASSELEVTP